MAVAWIRADREDLGGKPRIAVTRISIEFLLDYRYSAARRFPGAHGSRR
jgi:uncharacterized protein (DUF433 family)